MVKVATLFTKSDTVFCLNLQVPKVLGVGVSCARCHCSVSVKSDKLMESGVIANAIYSC